MGKFLYILRSDKSGRYYYGTSDQPIRRLTEHNAVKQNLPTLADPG